MSDDETGGLDHAGRLALASPYSRREWGLALAIMGSRADELLPTVQELSAIGWAPSAAAHNLLEVLAAYDDHCETAAERMGP